jgi:hypothetical protein
MNGAAVFLLWSGTLAIGLFVIERSLRWLLRPWLGNDASRARLDRRLAAHGPDMTEDRRKLEQRIADIDRYRQKPKPGRLTRKLWGVIAFAWLGTAAVYFFGGHWLGTVPPAWAKSVFGPLSILFVGAVRLFAPGPREEKDKPRERAMTFGFLVLGAAVLLDVTTGLRWISPVALPLAAAAACTFPSLVTGLPSDYQPADPDTLNPNFATRVLSATVFVLSLGIESLIWWSGR